MQNQFTVGKSINQSIEWSFNVEPYVAISQSIECYHVQESCCRSRRTRHVWRRTRCFSAPFFHANHPKRIAWDIKTTRVNATKRIFDVFWTVLYSLLMMDCRLGCHWLVPSAFAVHCPPTPADYLMLNSLLRFSLLVFFPAICETHNIPRIPGERKGTKEVRWNTIWRETVASRACHRILSGRYDCTYGSPLFHAKSCFISPHCLRTYYLIAAIIFLCIDELCLLDNFPSLWKYSYASHPFFWLFLSFSQIFSAF